MFERFTDRCRKVMVLANQQAHELKHDYIGTEHMLLALIREGTGMGFHALKNLGVDFGALQTEIGRLVKEGSWNAGVGKLPQTPRGRKVIEYAIAESRRLGQDYVGTEHMLLGMIVEGEGVAAQALRNRGVELDAAREEVKRLLDAANAAEAGLRLFRIRSSARSFWVESTDATSAVEVWQRRMRELAPGDEAVKTPDAIDQMSDGPVWR
ncbi:MAG: hypothetical protein IT430_00220 [Phycisphaerales bacterium]|nr:hypothetical protein [Phycisphaerales bacterium]